MRSADGRGYGEIRAIANLTVQEGYQEKVNYSNARSGSTFKLASYMTLFDQHKIIQIPW